jgi:hypothetical protein
MMLSGIVTIKNQKNQDLEDLFDFRDKSSAIFLS